MSFVLRSATSAAALALVLTLAGCASSPGTSAGSQPATPPTAGTATTTPTPAPERAASVVVPKQAARKLVLAMHGPKTVVESKDWAEFKREWRETFADHAKAQGVQFSFVDGEAKPTGEDGTLLQVHVNDYRVVGIGARIWFGAMTGNAYIDARARYASLRDGQVFGEQPYSTTSSAWSGVFAKVTPQQVDQIASHVFMDLKAAK